MLGLKVHMHMKIHMGYDINGQAIFLNRQLSDWLDGILEHRIFEDASVCTNCVKKNHKIKKENTKGSQ